VSGDDVFFVLFFLFVAKKSSSSSYVGATDEAVADDIMLDRTTMEEKPVMVVRDPTNHAVPQAMWAVVDAAKDSRKRKWVLGILLFTLCMTAAVEGLLLVSERCFLFSEKKT
jgi:hypothetical protein